MNKPIAIRTPGFSKPEALPGPISVRAAASLLARVGDIAFVLDADGRILDVAVSAASLANDGFADLIGDNFADIVTSESRAKVGEMLAEAASTGVLPRWRQVNHPTSGVDVPIRYLMVALDARNRLIAIGRDMREAAAAQQRLIRTQQSLERDYVKLREAEMGYRMLFDAASEPILVIDAATRRIREANPAAHRLLGAADSTLIGKAAGAIVDPRDRDACIAHLGAAEAVDAPAPVTLRLAQGRGDARITAKLFRRAGAPLLLVRIGSTGTAARPPGNDAPLADVIERMPDAFVLVDRDHKVLTANVAFVDLTGTASPERVIGEPLGAWLGRPGIDLDAIVAELRDHGSIRNVALVMRGPGGPGDVEVSAVAAPTDAGECYGFVIRDVGQRPRDAPAVPREAPRSGDQLIELVGRMSLKEIVRESTDLIERLCIEAALLHTSDNRASAAEVLGVSRQSLYSKLHRHGLGNLAPIES